MDSIIIQLIFSFVATVAAAITLEAPQSLVYKAGFAGFLSYAIYLWMLRFASQVVATLVAIVVISFVSQIFARKFKTPVTIFYIPIFYLFVPGSFIYQTAFFFIQGEYSTALYYMGQTLTIAGAIALGVFLTDSMLEIYTHVKSLIKARQTNQ